MWNALVRPRAFVAGLDGDRANRWSVALVVGLWISWGAFLIVLAHFEHAPSGPLFVPVAREHYYVVQALLIGPLFALSTTVASWVTCRLLLSQPRRRSGKPVVVDRRVWRTAVTASLTTSTLLALVAPDAILFAFFGFDTLGQAIPLLAPFAALLMVWRVATAARVLAGLSTTRALVLGVLAVVIHLVITAPFLR